MSPAASGIGALALLARKPKPEPSTRMWYETRCCASGSSSFAKTPAAGSSSTQGAVASTRKKSAPVSRTLRSTSDSRSPSMPDARACDPDGGSWPRPTPPSYIAGMATTTHASQDGGGGWQLEPDSAEAYERYLVPALMAAGAQRLLELASLSAGERVLDVGCGTGIVARSASAVVGVKGRVVGIDLNEGML